MIAFVRVTVIAYEMLDRTINIHGKLGKMVYDFRQNIKGACIETIGNTRFAIGDCIVKWRR